MVIRGGAGGAILEATFLSSSPITLFLTPLPTLPLVLSETGYMQPLLKSCLKLFQVSGSLFLQISTQLVPLLYTDFCAHVTLSQNPFPTNLTLKKSLTPSPCLSLALFFFIKPLTAQHIIYLFIYCLSFPLRIRTQVTTISSVPRIVPA